MPGSSAIRHISSTGVWLGNDDNSPTKRATGGSLPVEIWSKVMSAALQDLPPEGLPYGIWRNPNPFAQPPGTAPVASNGLFGASLLAQPPASACTRRCRSMRRVRRQVRARAAFPALAGAAMTTAKCCRRRRSRMAAAPAPNEKRFFGLF